MELCDEQLWENDEYALKIENLGFIRAIIFKKTGKSLKFSEIVIDRKGIIEKLIVKMGMKLTNKMIIIKGD